MVSEFPFALEDSLLTIYVLTLKSQSSHAPSH